MYLESTLAPAGSSRSVKGRIGSFVAVVRAYHRAWRDQARLSNISDQMLSDIGLTWDDVREIRRIPYYHL